MKNANVAIAIAFALVCFGSGYALGARVTDQWEIAQHDNCVATIQIIVPQSLPTCALCVHPNAAIVTQRRLALSNAVQSLIGCDKMAGLATPDELALGRLNELIDRY